MIKESNRECGKLYRNTFAFSHLKDSSSLKNNPRINNYIKHTQKYNSIRACHEGKYCAHETKQEDPRRTHMEGILSNQSLA